MSKNNATEMVMILDRSGSMHGLEKDTVGGFNSMLEKQQKEDGKGILSTVVFNQVSHVVHNRQDIQNVHPMETTDFRVGGSTSLYDAIGQAIHHISQVHKSLPKEEVPDKTVFVIITDGMENSSKIYTLEKIHKMIEKKKAKKHWEFIFLGANIDAVSTAQDLGIAKENAVEYLNDEAGVQANYDAVSTYISQVRTHSQAPAGSWKASVEADYAARAPKSRTSRAPKSRQAR